MPAQTAKSSALEKLRQSGAAKAFEAHKADEIRMPAGGGLPPGIEGGVAQLTEADLKLHDDPNKKDIFGKPYLSLVGIVIEPENIQGLRASKFVPLYGDTPRPGATKVKSQDDRIAEALNEMRKLGVQTEGLNFDDWELALTGLKQESPHFRFRTWQGQATKQYPNPRVNTDFLGLVKGFQSNGAPVVEDQTGVQEAGDGGVPAGGTQDAAGETDWATIGELAAQDDEGAQQQLSVACQQYGIDPNGYETWTEVSAAILEAQGGAQTGESGGEEAGSDWKPKEGEVYMYRATKGAKPQPCTVTKVFSSTVNLKRESDQKTFKAVPWDALEQG